MVRFRSTDLCSNLGGQLTGDDVTVDGVSIDSRTVVSGNLFVPIRAERDGHEFVPAAVEAGAAAYLSEVGLVAGAEGATVIEVDDTMAGLSTLGRVARGRLSCPVIGVTGSVGKTSMKDLIRAACETSRVTHASEKSFNNELGVPLTLANAPDDVEVVIVEMGARGAGHIAELCETVMPTVGVITMVALAHSELFGSIEGVAAAKAELVRALPSEGVAVLNADDPLVAAMAAQTSATVVTFGLEGGDVRAVGIELDDLLRPMFRLETPAGSAELSLGVAGAHMALNAAGAVAAALAVGVDLGDAVAGLAGASLSPWRMEVVRAPSGLLVINDAYNANPTSMRAALRSLVALPASELIAVVGEMAELGEEGPGEHLAITSEAVEAGVRLIAVGAPAYGSEALHVSDRAEVLSVLGDLGEVGEGIAVLVKGSRVAGLELVAADLLAVPGE
ncbi:MAG: UDP-N-acetylmuramoyl-tripeptide--D-alanyl-D-alanine ligase [Actinomycetia bacterium]|nr:UDP-N-acetylmuramoyl-tripeptide--D-alanyl-D-alanine ligase [Actinomycetes bacterium]